MTGAPPACTIKSSAASPTIEDGQQIAITRPQTCEAAPACTHSIQLSTTVTTAVAHFNSYTWTSEMGTEVRPTQSLTCGCTPVERVFFEVYS